MLAMNVNDYKWFSKDVCSNNRCRQTESQLWIIKMCKNITEKNLSKQQWRHIYVTVVCDSASGSESWFTMYLNPDSLIEYPLSVEMQFARNLMWFNLGLVSLPQWFKSIPVCVCIYVCLSVCHTALYLTVYSHSWQGHRHWPIEQYIMAFRVRLAVVHWILSFVIWMWLNIMHVTIQRWCEISTDIILWR